MPRRLSPHFSLRAVALLAFVLFVGPPGAAPGDAGFPGRDTIPASEDPISAGQPVVSAGQPVVSAGQPVASAGPPVISAVPPIRSPGPPVVSADPPVVSAGPPVVSAEPPVVSADPPVVSADPPVSSASPPVDSVQPALSDQAVSAGQPIERQTSDFSGSYMRWPTTGRITQPYGCTGFWANQPLGSCRHFHTGIDIANAKWTPIRAAASGRVRFVGREPWGAWMVVIGHGDGLRSRYAHLVPTRVAGIAKGRAVRKGQLIGYMGKSGMATGVHLHFEVKLDGRYVNPGRYLPTSRP